VTRDGITTSYAYDQVGRLLSAGDTTYGFDADGDLTTAGGDTFSYDSAGHLTAASVGGKPSTYQYDGDGLRVSATANGTTTPYVLDQAAALPVVLGAGDHAYTRTPDGQLLGDTSSGATLTPLADALGSIRAVTDSTGTVVGTAAYDGYGNAAVGTGQQTAFGYTGALADAGGLVDLNAREYDPATGRFLQSDSNETGGPGTTGYNRYAYALDDPTTATDPTGHQGDFTLGGVMEGIDLQDVLTKTLVATVATTGTIGLLLVGAHALEDVRDRPSERPDYLYKTGSLGAMSWTPRPGADTDGWPQNGLSFYTSAERAIEKAMENPNAKKVPNVWRVPADEVEAIPGLMIVVDAGDETHWFVTGVLPTILEEWANTRATAAERPSTWTAALISMAEAA
jgi:RHS repeat-associated protein